MINNRRVAFSPAFTQNFKHLQKRYQHIGDDLRSLLDQLREGHTPGDQVPGIGHLVYKARIRNSDAKRGKSGGYRAVYYLQTAEQVVMIALYSKSDQSEMPTHVIRRIIEDYQAGGI